MNKEKIIKALPAGRADSIVILEACDSTNSVLKELARSGAPSGSIVISDHQSAGRGRLGRSFASPAATGIYYSYLMRPDASFDDVISVTSCAAVSAARAIERVTGLSPSIKWVNDIMIEGKKVCGILCEALNSVKTGRIEGIIIGIGINVNTKAGSFPDDIRDTAGSLSMFTCHDISREEITAALISESDRLASMYRAEENSPSLSEYLYEYRRRCITPGNDVDILRGGEIIASGHAEQINDDFSVRVRYPDGTYEDISSGEVSVRLNRKPVSRP